MINFYIQLSDNYRLHLVREDWDTWDNDEGILTLDRKDGENLKEVTVWSLADLTCSRFIGLMTSTEDCEIDHEYINRSVAADLDLFDIKGKGAADFEDAIDCLVKYVDLCTGEVSSKLYSNV